MKKQLFYWKKDVLLKNIFIQSLPFAIVVLFMTIYARIDTILLEKFAKNGLEEVGIYASAFRLLDTANMFGYLFAGLLLPMFATLLGKKKELLPLLELSLTLMIIGTVSVTAIVFCNRFEISTILYHQSNPYWGNVLGSLIFCFIANGIGNYIFSALLTANDNLKQLAYLYAAGIVVSVGVNLLLIPKHGALGAAWAGCVTQFLLMFGQIGLSVKLLEIRFSRQWVTSIFAFIMLIFLMMLSNEMYFHFSLFINSFLIILCVIISSLMLGLINISAILNLKENIFKK